MDKTYVGLGLVFGAGIGTLLASLLSKDVSIYASIGGGIGLVVGSAVQLMVKRNSSIDDSWQILCLASSLTGYIKNIIGENYNFREVYLEFII